MHPAEIRLRINESLEDLSEQAILAMFQKLSKKEIIKTLMKSKDLGELSKSDKDIAESITWTCFSRKVLRATLSKSPSLEDHLFREAVSHIMNMLNIKTDFSLSNDALESESINLLEGCCIFTPEA